MNNKHIIIIGSGPGGLTAAMILAHRGFKITVLEKKPTIGGRNSRIQLGDYLFDTGPTFLMMKFILDEMFAEVGCNIDDYLVSTRLEPMYHLWFHDREFKPTTDRSRMIDQIQKLFPGNERGYKRFLLKERARFEHLYPCIQKNYSSLKTYLHPVLIRALPYLSFGKAIFDNLGRYYTDDALKTSFTFQAKYLGMSPWDCPAFFTIIPYIEHAFGVYHTRGGLSEISHALATVAKDKGAEIKTGMPVKRIIVKNKTAVGVELDDTTKIEADGVIINADFAHAMAHLFEPNLLRKYTAEKLNKLKYSCSTFMLYLGVKKTYDIAHHSIIFSRDYRRNIDEVANKKILSQDISLYLRNASITDPTLAPKGKSSLYILVPVPNNSSHINWEKESKPLRRKVFDVIKNRTPLKDIEENIEVEKMITPFDWEHTYDIYNGATFNLAHYWSQLLYFRPRNKFEEFKNCYLVGGGTHPGSGLPTIFESARITSNLISKQYSIPFRKPPKLNKSLYLP
ncbi:MAG: phytoene desaturase [Elusimicrobia bacterium]|nr:phytoene desaturase [Elusimicrobiota bacterium]MBD3412197.1 phytoene desaturase [Elusimicrobiota bacterium]